MSFFSVNSVARTNLAHSFSHTLLFQGTGSPGKTFYNRFLLEIPISHGGKRECNETAEMVPINAGFPNKCTGA